MNFIFWSNFHFDSVIISSIVSARMTKDLDALILSDMPKTVQFPRVGLKFPGYSRDILLCNLKISFISFCMPGQAHLPYDLYVINYSYFFD